MQHGSMLNGTAAYCIFRTEASMKVLKFPLHLPGIWKRPRKYMEVDGTFRGSLNCFLPWMLLRVRVRARAGSSCKPVDRRLHSGSFSLKSFPLSLHYFHGRNIPFLPGEVLFASVELAEASEASTSSRRNVVSFRGYESSHFFRQCLY